MDTKIMAVIEVSGKQHLVSAGDKIVVTKLDKKEGDKFTLKDLLKNIEVELEVLNHKRGKKVRGLKFRAKSNYLKRYGQRDEQTVLEIVAVGGKAAEKSVAKTMNKETGVREVKKPASTTTSVKTPTFAKASMDKPAAKKVSAGKSAVKKSAVAKAKADKPPVKKVEVKKPTTKPTKKEAK